MDSRQMQFFVCEAEDIMVQELDDKTLLCKHFGPPRDDLFKHSLTEFVITEQLRDALVRLGLSGLIFESISISFQRSVDEAQSRQLVRLNVTGVPFVDDFGYSRYELIISRAVVEALQHFEVQKCQFQPVEQSQFEGEGSEQKLVCTFCCRDDFSSPGDRLVVALEANICSGCIRHFDRRKSSHQVQKQDSTEHRNCSFCEKQLPSNACVGDGNCWICFDDLAICKSLLT